MEKHIEHVADEHLRVTSPTVAKVMVLASWGLPKSDGTKETRPKRTLKGADGESDDGSPGAAVAYLAPKFAGKRLRNARDCEKRVLRGDSLIGFRVDINLSHTNLQSQGSSLASSFGGKEKTRDCASTMKLE